MFELPIIGKNGGLLRSIRNILYSIIGMFSQLTNS